MFVRPFLAALMLVTLTAAISAQDKEKKPIALKILLPRDDATVTINDHPLEVTGKTREAKLPSAEVGKSVACVIQATIVPNNYTTITRTRKIQVDGGGSYTV